MRFDYFYGAEAESFSFYRRPRRIVKGEEFRNLSTDAKLLYGLLLDRMGLSARNNWRDAGDRVFIYYPLSNIQEDLNCGHDKATKLLNELDSKKGVGLIERVKQGLGKPDRIYVMRFYAAEHGDMSRSPECGKTAVRDAEKPQSEAPENRSPECGKAAGSYIDNIHTDFSYTDQSISQSEYEDAMEDVKEQLEYPIIEEAYPNEDTDCIAEIICEVLCSKQSENKVGRERLPTAKVQARYRMLRFEHICYVLDSIRDSASRIKNIKSYLITARCKAPL